MTSQAGWQTFVDGLSDEQVGQLFFVTLERRVDAVCAEHANFWDAFCAILGVTEDMFTDEDQAASVYMTLFGAGARWRDLHQDEPVPAIA